VAKRAKNRTVDAALGKSRRLYIRHPAKGDRAEWCELWDASWNFLKPWFPRPTSAAAGAADSRFSSMLNTCNLHTGQQHLVCRRSDDRIVGMVNLGQIFHGPFRNCYMGYWVGEAFAQNGYTSEGVRLVLQRAFGKLELHRVEANIIPQNDASISLARRIGFREEGYSPRYLKIAGQWQDHVRFAMTLEDWRELRKQKR